MRCANPPAPWAGFFLSVVRTSHQEAQRAQLANFLKEQEMDKDDVFEGMYPFDWVEPGNECPHAAELVYGFDIDSECMAHVPFNGTGFEPDYARRIAASLNVCSGVPIDLLEGMGVGSMERQRDRAFEDRQAREEAIRHLKALLDRLHPGAVGLIADYHGLDAQNKTCEAIVSAKNFLSALDR